MYTHPIVLHTLAADRRASLVKAAGRRRWGRRGRPPASHAPPDAARRQTGDGPVAA
jgi:hypothetical protein